MCLREMGSSPRHRTMTMIFIQAHLRITLRSVYWGEGTKNQSTLQLLKQNVVSTMYYVPGELLNNIKHKCTHIWCNDLITKHNKIITSHHHGVMCLSHYIYWCHPILPPHPLSPNDLFNPLIMAKNRISFLNPLILLNFLAWGPFPHSVTSSSLFILASLAPQKTQEVCVCVSKENYSPHFSFCYKQEGELANTSIWGKKRDALFCAQIRRLLAKKKRFGKLPQETFLSVAFLSFPFFG